MVCIDVDLGRVRQDADESVNFPQGQVGDRIGKTVPIRSIFLVLFSTETETLISRFLEKGCIFS